MIRLAIVGCGGMSHAFTDRFVHMADRIQLVAAVDQDPELAEAAAAMFPGARAATDYRDVLDDVDAGVLVLPHQLHRDVGVAFLEAGKHVLLEKPMANTEQECRDLIDAADRSGKTLMIAYIMRYHPLVLEMKKAIDRGEIGNVFQLSIWTEQYTRRPEGHWTRSADMLGGGQLFSHGCHYIDLLMWFLGRPVSGTHMGTNLGTPWMEKEGTSHVSIQFENGAVGYHAGTWGARGTRLRTTFHAHGEKGMLEADFARGTLTVLRNARVDGHHAPPKDEVDPQKAGEELLCEVYSSKHSEAELLHFIECIETGRTPDTEPRQSLQSLRLIWRLYEAEHRGEVADLTGLGLDQYDDAAFATR